MGENQNTQLLEIFDADEIERSVCGFLNATGGLLLVGVRSDGNVSGVDDAARKSDFLQKQFIWVIYPEAPISISVIDFQKKSLIAISVFSGSQPPYTCNRIIYIRRGTITTKAIPDDIHLLVAIRGKNEMKWERQLCHEQQMQEMDEFEIRRSIRNLAASGRGKVFPEANAEEFLSHFGLMQNRTFNRAAVVLFGREPARFYPQCRIRIAIFNGVESGNSCSYERFLDGHAFRNLDDIKRFFEVNLYAVHLKNPSKTNKQTQSLPMEALNEILINAIIHRDYSDINDCIQIALYPDRLEISNPGIMEIKPKKNHGSGPLPPATNPEMTYLFFIRKLADRAGSGLFKILNDCDLNGIQRPKWEMRNNRTYVIFPGLTLRGNQSELQADKSDEDPRNHFPDGISLQVARRLIDLLGFVHSNRNTKVADLELKFQLSKRSVKTNLKQLSDTGFIQYSGSKKTGSYILTDAGKLLLKK